MRDYNQYNDCLLKMTPILMTINLCQDFYVVLTRYKTNMFWFRPAALGKHYCHEKKKRSEENPFRFNLLITIDFVKDVHNNLTKIDKSRKQKTQGILKRNDKR